jgi:ATP-dependent DNA helicase RecQ
MVLRTARKGKNAGEKFYGCSRWRIGGKGCNGTVPIGNEGTNFTNTERSVTEISLSTTNIFSFPKTLVARSKHHNFQSRFIESVAVPYSLLEKIRSEDFPEHVLQRYAQWRLDYPLPSETPTVSKPIRQVLAVAEKLLTRGRITLCSLSLEEKLSAHFACDVVTALAEVADYYLGVPTVNAFSPTHWFDSSSEKLFYSEILPEVLGEGWFQWVHPQVEISSLISDNAENQLSGRVDFLFCYPGQPSIIIEIDGDQHMQHKDADVQRDNLLENAGYRVLRLRAQDVDARVVAPRLNEIIGTIPRTSKLSDSENGVYKTIQAIKLTHQIQIAVLQAIEAGFLDPLKSSKWVLDSDLNQIGIFPEQDGKFLLETALFDLLDVLRTLGNLYQVDLCDGTPTINKSRKKQASLFLSFTNHFDGISTTFVIQNIFFPRHIAHSGSPSTPTRLSEPKISDIEFFLNYLFRKASLWEGQFDAISRALEGKDSIVLLPTGAGKSIAFQLAGLLLPGRAVIIDPIISLMDDQIDNLQNIGIDRCIAITSQITDVNERQQVIKLFGQGEYLFAYVAPERFQTVAFRESLRSLTVHTPVSLIAIDEAHCVSEWGHDFRTSYLNIGRTSRDYCESQGHTPPLLALTGTASRAVLKDVQRELQVQDFEAIITPKSFDRPELTFEVLTSSSSEKGAQLLGYLGQVLPSKFSLSSSTFFQTRGEETCSGLVFCPHVNGNFGVITQSDEIRKALGISTEYYSGKEPKNTSRISWGLIKQKTALEFKHNLIPLLVSTKAFGMGIDKPNIRYTVHFGIPNSIESFYQEAGRAGRDRKTAHCCIMVSVDDLERAEQLLSPNTSAEVVQQLIKKVGWDNADDVTRALFFQSNAFPGVQEEQDKTISVLGQIGDLTKKANRPLVVKENENISGIEKGLHRLSILGIVDDYTINYANKEFSIRVTGASKQIIIESYQSYVKGYSQDRAIQERQKSENYIDLEYHQFIHSMIRLLLSFIYDVIEKGRRRALFEMVQVATEHKSDSAIRKRILDYLDTTQYSQELEVIVNAIQAGLTQLKMTFEKIRSPNDASELRGQVSRYLESYPDHPGLLLLRALSEIKTKDSNQQVTIENFIAAAFSAIDNYGIAKPLLFEIVVWGIQQVFTTNHKLADELMLRMLERFPERDLARHFISDFGVSFATQPAWLLIHQHVKRSMVLLNP